eukprot:2986546-Pleurochrysis_carterae.AAC.1
MDSVSGACVFYYLRSRIPSGVHALKGSTSWSAAATASSFRITPAPPRSSREICEVNAGKPVVGGK